MNRVVLVRRLVLPVSKQKLAQVLGAYALAILNQLDGSAEKGLAFPQTPNLLGLRPVLLIWPEFPDPIALIDYLFVSSDWAKLESPTHAALLIAQKKGLYGIDAVNAAQVRLGSLANTTARHPIDLLGITLLVVLSDPLKMLLPMPDSISDRAMELAGNLTCSGSNVLNIHLPSVDLCVFEMPLLILRLPGTFPLQSILQTASVALALRIAEAQILESGVKTHSGAAFEARVTGVVTRFLASTLTALVVK